MKTSVALTMINVPTVGKIRSYIDTDIDTDIDSKIVVFDLCPWSR